MRVLVCGGRNYIDVPKLWRVLDDIQTKQHISPLIDGASDDVTGPYVGADYWANQWALARDISCVRVHADWKKLGRGAGPARNQRMLDEQRPDLVIAFPGARGTADMVRRARVGGIAVVEIE